MKFEVACWKQGFKVVAGTDEAGRGPLAGPVVAAAFAVLEPDAEVLQLLASIKDSKKMTMANRDAAFEELTHSRFEGRTIWAIAQASVSEISRVNILQAALAAMERSVRRLTIQPDCVLVDGCNRPPGLLSMDEAWTRGTQTVATLYATTGTLKVAPRRAWRPRRVDSVIKGDDKVLSISAASILAKVHRDRIMAKLDKKYPAYGFISHKGYGTSSHMKVLKAIGYSPAHRTTFAPVNTLSPAKAAAMRAQPSVKQAKAAAGPAAKARAQRKLAV